MQSDDQSPCGMPGLHPACTRERIRDQYRRLVLQYHPDRNPSPDAARILKDVIEAYRNLSDPSTRSRYDGTIGADGQNHRPGHVDNAGQAARQDRIYTPDAYRIIKGVMGRAGDSYRRYKCPLTMAYGITVECGSEPTPAEIRRLEHRGLLVDKVIRRRFRKKCTLYVLIAGTARHGRAAV